jgi:CDP-glycerol glycerophosphotransferase
VRDRVRAELGLAPGTTAVLYAPTWRDDRNVPGGGFEQQAGFDAARLRAALPGSVVVLARMHKNVARRPEYDAPGFVIDVSEHPSVAELYLAADVLVSDYSSVVFDFAVTRKPIVLFPYDLEHYEQTVRGLYFDYADWAPGPVVRSTEELAEALLAASAPGASTGPSYDAFVERFCPWDDGRAAARVWQAVL